MEQEAKTYKPINRAKEIINAELSKETRELLTIKMQFDDALNNLMRYKDTYCLNYGDEQSDKVINPYLEMMKEIDSYLIDCINANLCDLNNTTTI